MIFVENSNCRVNSEISRLVENPMAFSFFVRPALQQRLLPNPIMIEIHFPGPFVFFIWPNQLQGREVIALVKRHRIAEVIWITSFRRFSKDTIVTFQQAGIFLANIASFAGFDSLRQLVDDPMRYFGLQSENDDFRMFEAMV